MKAMLWTAYGPPEVLQMGELPRPVPKDKEILVRIHASTVTAGDCEMRRFDVPVLMWPFIRLFMGIRKPRVGAMGQELAGEVVEVGPGVTRFRPGDRVFAPTDMKLGAHAEYKCLPEGYAIGRKPDSLGYGEAASLPVGGLNAVHFFRKVDLQAGKKVLVIGAGGSIGTFAVQMAKSMGAEVTAIDRGDKLDMLRDIGADQVVDYTREDFSRGGPQYDVIFEVAGKGYYSRAVRSLNKKGRYLLANPSFSRMIRGLFTALFRGKKVMTGLARYTQDDMAEVVRLVETGAVRPVIDRVYPLEEAAQAHRYVESGAKAGSVVIRIGPED